MTEIFLPQVDFGEVIYNVARQGWSFQQQAFSLDWCRQACALLPGLKWNYFIDDGEVYQEFEVATLRSAERRYPSVIDEADQLIGACVRQHAGKLVCLRSWQPTEVALQRYATPTARIGRHRDYMADVGLIVVITLQGSGKIMMYSQRHHGGPSHTLETVMGSMMVLAGTGVLSDDAMRPTHSVEPVICSPRTSMAFRMPVGNKPG